MIGEDRLKELLTVGAASSAKMHEISEMAEELIFLREELVGLKKEGGGRMSEKKGCPERIYLQACDACYEDALQDGEVTWCEDFIGHDCAIDGEHGDSEYVRVDIYNNLLLRARDAVAELEDHEHKYENQYYAGERLNSHPIEYTEGLVSCYKSAWILLHKHLPEAFEEEK